MHELVSVAFPDITITQQATEAIQSLHAESSIKIYRAFVLVRDPSGKLSTREIIKRGHGATAVGALIGGLAGLPLGPPAMAIGAVGFAIIGYSAELLHEHDARELLLKVSRDTVSGRSAAVVEIAKDGVNAFAERMEWIGGIVSRK
jgi:uncharacterized membrane protein